MRDDCGDGVRSWHGYPVEGLVVEASDLVAKLLMNLTEERDETGTRVSTSGRGRNGHGFNFATLRGGLSSGHLISELPPFAGLEGYPTPGCTRYLWLMNLLPFERGDLSLVEPWFRDPETQRWLGGPSWPQQMLDLADRPLGEFRGAKETGRLRWLARNDNEPVGYIDCGTFDRWTTWDGEKVTGSVDVASGALTLTVAPARRCMGYGREVLEALFEAPEVAHIELFGAGVEPENVSCVACLTAAGFTRQEYEPDFEGMLYLVRQR
jgi:ribosomal protein S18 acetylase RimI-like enzyme